jgi:hypothetical protein
MSKPARTLAVLVVSLAMATAWHGLSGTALAQRRRQQGPALPQPVLRSVFPLGVAVGGTAEVTLRGLDLEGVTTLWFDHPGLTATHVKGLTFRITCAKETSQGLHDVRAVGPYGISNPRVIAVSGRPEAVEIEPNNTPEQAGPLAVNTSVSGVLGAVDVDCFAVAGKKGQRLLFDLQAERLDSPLDATMRLLDPAGREIAECRDAIGIDPFLDVTIPADGRYVVKVHDVTYRGSSDTTYRLTVSDGPHIDAIVPVAARPGQTAAFTLIGRNLGGTAAPELTADGRPLERKTVTIGAPKTADLDPDAPTGGFVPSTASPRRGFEYALDTPAGRSNPVFLAPTDDPVIIEREPNDAEHAQEVAPPCDISGAFGAPGDFDVYRFRAKKASVWWVEASAERIGSQADPGFVIQRVSAKGETSDLATGDDQPDRGGQARFPTGTVDAAARFQAPDDGLYQVIVSDLYGSQRGDPRLAYRLSIRPERPDFHLFLLPDSPDQPDALTLNAGGRALAYVLAVRRDGFTGPIRVEPVRLPAGVKCVPVVIPAGQPLAPVVFEAAEGVAPVTGTVRLAGHGRFGKAPDATATAPDTTHEAVGGVVVWPAEGGQSGTGTPGLSRITRGFAMRVVGRAPLSLTAGPAVKTVSPGSLLALDLSVKRRDGFTEAVAVSLLAPLPAQANPPTTTIAKGADLGVFAFTLPRTIDTGVYTLVFQGTGPYPFSKDPGARNKPNVNLSEPSNPVTLVVRPAPVNVSARLKGGTLKAGASAEVEVTVNLKDGAAGPVKVAIASPAGSRLTAEPITVTPGKTAKLILKGAAGIPAGPAVGVGVRVTVQSGGEPFEFDEPLALTIVK